MANFPVLKKVFSRGVLVTILAIELEIDVLLSRNLLSYVRYEPKTSLCLQMFNCSPRNGCFILAKLSVCGLGFFVALLVH